MPNSFLNLDDFKPEIMAAGKKAIEVGGGNNPLFPLCLQVDKYKSLEDLYTQSGKLKAFLKMRAEDSKDSKHFGTFKYENIYKNNAAAIDGVIADAEDLPFENESITHIISKCFPWYGGRRKELIERILTEYKRVLINSGKVIAISNSLLWEKNKDDLDKTYFEHIIVANKLGFNIQYIAGIVILDEPIICRDVKTGEEYEFYEDNLTGIVLTKMG